MITSQLYKGFTPSIGHCYLIFSQNTVNSNPGFVKESLLTTNYVDAPHVVLTILVFLLLKPIAVYEFSDLLS